MLETVFRQLETLKSVEALATAEARASSVRSYMTGLVQGAVRADPALRAAFAAEFTAFCSGTPEPRRPRR